jgi:hypothetical protein
MLLSTSTDAAAVPRRLPGHSDNRDRFEPTASVRRRHEQSSDPKPMRSKAALCGQIVEKCIIRIAQRPHCPHGAGPWRYVICQFRVPRHEHPSGCSCSCIMHGRLGPAIPSLRCDTVRPMWILALAGLIGTEASSKFFVRVVWPIMLVHIANVIRLARGGESGDAVARCGTLADCFGRCSSGYSDHERALKPRTWCPS